MLQYLHYSQKDQGLVCKARSHEEIFRFHLQIQFSQQVPKYFLYLFFLYSVEFRNNFSLRDFNSVIELSRSRYFVVSVETVWK